MARVLHLYNILGASVERFSFDTTLALAQCGHDITLGYETQSEECPPTVLPRVQLQRIHVNPTDDVDAQMHDIGNDPADPQMRRLLDDRFDLIHGHFGPRILQGAAWLLRQTPMVVSIHGYDASRLLHDPTWIARYRWAAQHGATFVTVNRAQREMLIGLDIDAARARYIPVGLDIAGWPYQPSPAPTPPRFLFVGRLSPKKAPDVLLAAIAALRDRHQICAQLTFIGDGPLADDLNQIVEQRALQDQITFRGHVPREHLAQHLQHATALIMPSVTAPDGDTEGMPRVLLEAQACGLPCITTDHAGNPDAIPSEGHPFIVPENDIRSLAESMRAMIALSPTQRDNLAALGRQRVEQHFDLNQSIDQYHALYTELTDPQPHAVVAAASAAPG